jgi:uncharacterized protein (DUF3820 family)
LIRLVRVERGFGKWARRYFEIVHGTEEYPAWFHPQVALYPLTQIGRKDYRKLKEEAEAARVKPSTYYIRTRPSRVESLARELRVPRREIEHACSKGDISISHTFHQHINLRASLINLIS